MPDPILMLESIAAALVASALMVAAGRLSGRRWAGTFQAAAIALGAYLGLAVLGVRPKWPMSEDQDRFLGVVLPGVLGLEAILAAVRFPVGVRLGVRILASMAVAPVLLHGSIYVADLAGPGSAFWPPAWRYPILAGLGLVLFGVWSWLEWEARRSGSALRVPFAQAIAIGGASLCVMLSGYASGGMNGLPMAAAAAGGSIAAALLRGDDRDAVPGVGAVMLAGLLLVGYCFGELRIDAAAGLALAPLLALVSEVPPLARRGPRIWTACALALVGLATAGVVGLTVVRFQATAAAGSKGAVGLPTADDYSQLP